MRNMVSFFLLGPRLVRADAELRAELNEFSHDGLIALQLDLEHDIAFKAAGSSDRLVRRGTWKGCPLSYRLGFAGSVDADRNGQRNNHFTRLWDDEKYSRERVWHLVGEELATRRRPTRVARTPTPVQTGR